MIQADIPLIDSCSVLSELRLITEKLSIKCSTLLSGKTFKRNNSIWDDRSSVLDALIIGLIRCCASDVPYFFIIIGIYDSLGNG